MEGDVFDWIAGMVERTGCAGVATLMFVENLIPPIPLGFIRPAHEQSCRSLAPASSVTGPQNAALDVTQLRPTLHLHKRRRLQHLQSSAPSDLPPRE